MLDSIKDKKTEQEYYKRIRRYLAEEYSAVHDGQQLPDTWRHRKVEVEQQNNTYDCGVLASMFAEEIMLGNDLRYQPTDRDEYRVRMAGFIREVASNRFAV